MSLFAQLQSLYRPDRFLFEDFHTEIVAKVLQNSPELTLEWLRRINATAFSSADCIKIDTQQTFPALPGHSMASRPDICIRLISGTKKELVFVESKQGSVQGDDQLQRYADHLHAAQQRESLSRVSLVFITRDYESAETPQWMNEEVQLSFRRARWFEFYQHLKAHVNGDGLARELKLFMEENRMSLGNHFRSTDLVALENFVSAKSLMDETLDEEVLQAASRILGKVTFAKEFEELRDNPRYVLYHGTWRGDFTCRAGYWLPHNNPDQPVRVGLTIYSNPGSPARKGVVESFRSWVSGAGKDWEAHGLDDDKAWAVLHKSQPISALMSEPDHVRAVKDYLLTLLKEVELFLQTSPKFRQNVVEESTVSAEDNPLAPHV